MLDFFTTTLKTLDPDVYDLIGYEAERQARKIIMIPSESQAPEAVREALGSVFQNIYAEGYPNPDTHGLAAERKSSITRCSWPATGASATTGITRASSTRTSSRRSPGSGPPKPSPPTASRRRTSGRTCSRSPARRPTAPSMRRWSPSAHGHGHGPAPRRPSDPRQPGQPLGQAVQDRLVRHRPADRAAELRRRSRRWRASTSRR